jgi:Uma2 family endonuclease
MPAATTSVSEYLSTSYRPDCDYVDGEVLERNWGDHDHARLQGKVSFFFSVREKQWDIYVCLELRMRVSLTRFRVSDVCVFADEPEEQIPTKPPMLCAEILSPEDTMTHMQERINDFLTFGVSHVWVLDPRTKRAYDYTAAGMREVKDGVLRTDNPQITVPLAEIFS